MANYLLNNFSKGIVQDDATPWFLDAKNADWLITSYGLKLWPKVNKWLTTDGEPMRWISWGEQSDWNLESTLVWGDNGHLYKLNSADDTPAYTLSGGYDILAVELVWNDYYIFYQNDTFLDVATVSEWDVEDDTFGDMDETYITSQMNRSASAWCPAILITGSDEVFVWAEVWSVSKINLAAPSVTNFDGIVDNYAVWITAQWSTYMLYSRTGNVYMWDGSSTLNTGQKYLWSRISKVTQKLWVDYITTEDGQFYIWQGLSFQRVTRPRKSNRLDDNSSYDSILDFSIDDPEFRQNKSIYAVNDDIYAYTSDKVKGLYKYGSILPWTAPWFHKVICQNNAWVDIDYIYDMWYYERTLKRLYFSYKAWSTYWIDYVDIESLEAAPSWYIISEVFSANTRYEKEIQWIWKAVSNVSASNNIKIYYRVNNGSWVLLRTLNELTDVITVWEPIKTDNWTAFESYVDRQYKIELTNGNGGEDTPILHEIEEIYDLRNKNG